MNSSFLSLKIGLAYFLASIFLFWGCSNQEPDKPKQNRRKSPIAIAATTHEPTDTYIKIVYGQPYKNNRIIFGELVPYGEVWRTGANEATELTTTQPISFARKSLDAGTYALFSIPKKDNTWTIILNSELGQWGAFNYDSTKDVIRVEVPAESKEKVVEAFTIRFSDTVKDSSNIIMEWEQTEAKIPIEFIDAS